MFFICLNLFFTQGRCDAATTSAPEPPTPAPPPTPTGSTSTVSTPAVTGGKLKPICYTIGHRTINLFFLDCSAELVKGSLNTTDIPDGGQASICCTGGCLHFKKVITNILDPQNES